ncbi:MAG: hypothetical protein H6766_02570 [Candidatus Peribacteria bacterium]|nr:MAG: hypothetical protein H6766_02570 [Candidatus Peribacteria bacterium]
MKAITHIAIETITQKMTENDFKLIKATILDILSEVSKDNKLPHMYVEYENLSKGAITEELIMGGNDILGEFMQIERKKTDRDTNNIPRRKEINFIKDILRTLVSKNQITQQ